MDNDIAYMDVYGYDKQYGNVLFMSTYIKLLPPSSY